MAALQDNDAVIVGAARTPIGRARKGTLVDVRAEDLLVTALQGALERAGDLDPADVEDLVVGCAEPYGEQGQNIARRVALLLGRDDLPGATVNRFCASSLLATRMAFHAIRSGEGNAYLVGGVEQVSRNSGEDVRPHPAFAEASARVQQQLAGDGWRDPRADGLLPDYYIPMGLTAEFVARSQGVGRDEQDAWALQSQRRAAAAIDAGIIAREIVAVERPDGERIERDDSPRPTTTAEGLAALDPVFTPDGTVTAGNACPLNDGASALAVVSGRYARERGLRPLARIVSTGVHAISPEIMGIGLIGAAELALERAGLTASDLHAVEMNEAFAAQVVPSVRALALDPEIVNPHGGAIAFGHPFGSTGTRLIGSLINDLQELDGTHGLATLCVGGGQGMAAVIERLS